MSGAMSSSHDLGTTHNGLDATISSSIIGESYITHVSNLNITFSTSQSWKWNGSLSWPHNNEIPAEISQSCPSSVSMNTLIEKRVLGEDEVNQLSRDLDEVVTKIWGSWSNMHAAVDKRQIKKTDVHKPLLYHLWSLWKDRAGFPEDDSLKKWVGKFISTKVNKSRDRLKPKSEKRKYKSATVSSSGERVDDSDPGDEQPSSGNSPIRRLDDLWKDPKKKEQGCVVFLNGFPGVGKFTIAQAIKQHLPAGSIRFIDNYMLIGLPMAISPGLGTVYKSLRKEIQRVAFDALKDELVERPNIKVIMCGNLANEKADLDILADHVRIARDSDVPFHFINVVCDQNEHEKRLQSPARTKSGKNKILNVDKLRDYLATYQLADLTQLDSVLLDEVDTDCFMLNTTGLTPEQTLSKKLIRTDVEQGDVEIERMIGKAPATEES